MKQDGCQANHNKYQQEGDLNKIKFIQLKYTYVCVYVCADSYILFLLVCPIPHILPRSKDDRSSDHVQGRIITMIANTCNYQSMNTYTTNVPNLYLLPLMSELRSANDPVIYQFYIRRMNV